MRSRRFFPRFAASPASVARALAAFALVATVAPNVSSAADAPASPATPAHPAVPGWLGVAMVTPGDDGRPIDPAAPTDGVLVRHVIKTSPAAVAGMVDGDRIVAVAGELVGEAGDVTRKIATHAPGETVSVAVRRGTSQLVLPVLLTNRPSDADMSRMDLVGSFAPSWSGTIPIGSAPTAVDSLRGRVVIVDFWATWCGPCRLSMPRLAAWQTQYAARGLTVVGISNETERTVKAFLARNPAGFSILVDERADAARRYDISSLPTRAIIDRRGVIRDLVIGYNPRHDAEFEQKIEELLKEPAP